MGIQGLLPQLKSIMAPTHIKELRGERVAVDTYSWLHKGALSCSRDLCKGHPTTRHINYCMHRVNLLRHYGVRPVLVFDGGLLPMKSDQETKRSRTRKENFERALEHELAGNSAAAYECYQKAVDISPEIAFQLIQILRKETVDYIVAPYEADAQMAYLSIKNHVAAVITEDSDLIPFGCSRIIFKMDKFGQGVEFRSEMLAKNKDLCFQGFTKMMLLEMCIFSGCDYLQSLPGMGLKKAYTLIQNFKSFEKAIKHLKFNTMSVPPHYEDAFRKAIWTFQYQRVYDPNAEDIVHLSDIPGDLSTDCDFLGPWMPQDVAKGIAKGDIDPITKMLFQEHVNSDMNKTSITHDIGQAQARERKKLHLPVQTNTLANYFCLASIEAKRKFKAPQLKPPSLAPKSECPPKSGSPLKSEEGICKEFQSHDNVAFSSKGFDDGGHGKPDFFGSIHLKDNVANASKDKENQPEVDEIMENPRKRSSFFQSRNTLYKPFLASHKKKDSDLVIDVSIHKELTASRAIMETSDSSCLAGERSGDSISYKESLEIQDHSACKNVQSENDDHGKVRCDLTTKKRKGSGETAEGKWTKADENAHAYSPTLGKNLDCDLSHLDRYSGIAEESMKKFVSDISAFRYTPKNGSRVSGLRAPLKDVQDGTCNRSSTLNEKRTKITTSLDLSKFSYKPKLSKHGRTSASLR